MSDNPNNYYEAVPLDFLILEVLPDKGMIGGVHWVGRRARDVQAEIQDATGYEVTTSQLQARLRSLNVAGLVEGFPSIGQGRIWAKTPEGRAHLGRKAEILGLPEETPEAQAPQPLSEELRTAVDEPRDYADEPGYGSVLGQVFPPERGDR